MSDEIYYEIPVPQDLNSILAIHDGHKWVRGVIPGTVSVNNGIVSFTARWAGGKRQFMVAADLIGGYQLDAS